MLTALALAMLAIIATSYLARARSGRVTSAAFRQAALIDDGDDLIAHALAGEIAGALFVRPIAGPAGTVASANDRRRPPAPDARRYGTDTRHPYNFAPYHVVPFTNWPDGLAAPGEGNPPGGPGTSDTRWLRDLEPVRHDADGNGRPETFRYWRHLTNIARVENGFRVCRDISDVTDADGDGVGGVVLDLDIAHEQWLASVPPLPAHFAAATGDADASVWYEDADGNGHCDLVDVWQRWLGPAWSYRVLDPASIPPNLYHLKDLDADGVALERGERPGDEFAGPRADATYGMLGSPRWNVGRVLADADGDGFTDSHWFLSPWSVADGVRQIVAVAIIDNGAMLDFNTATRFVPGGVISGPNGPEPAGTAGQTPADLALAGERRADDGPGSWNVGFCDAPHQRESAFDYPPGYETGAPHPLYGPGLQVTWRGVQGGERWGDLLVALGVRGHPGDAFPNELLTRAERRRYRGGAAAGLTPFTIADELELRLHHGQNRPWLLSRFERALNTDSPFGAFLRSGRGFEESTPYLDQLDNAELLHDHRRKITLFNGARHDELPPWLHWRGPLPASVAGRPEAIARFVDQSRLRLDLREPPSGDVPPRPGERSLRERLPSTMLLALADGDENGGRGYFGPYDRAGGGADRIRRLAASFAANLCADRDQDTHAPVNEAVALPAWGDEPRDDSTRFLGIERQPFFVEAFIGHVYETLEIPGDPEAGVPGWTNSGRRVLVADDSEGRSLQSTIVAVQIANPFDEPIDLGDDRFTYEIELFGQPPVPLGRIATDAGVTSLPPARGDRPSTMVLYAIDEALGDATDFGARWRDFLDLDGEDHPAAAILADVTPWWSTRREVYDDSVSPAVRLVRVEDRGPGVEPVRVIVDRIDDAEAPLPATMRAAVRRLADDRPPAWDELIAEGVPAPSLAPLAPHPDGGWAPPAQDRTHWVQWVRVSRAWAFDVDGDGLTGPRERNPRFVFATGTLDTARVSALDPRPDYAERVFSAAGGAPGTSFTLANDPDSDDLDLGQPWITHEHVGADGMTRTACKPTFFERVDKGVYHSPYAMQMLQKDADFQQVGEVLNIWLWGHELDFETGGRYRATARTFSERLAEHQRERDDDEFANRLPPAPAPDRNATIGIAEAGALSDPRHAVPNLPAAVRVLDAFVCDGPGSSGERFDNARGFTGRATPGLVNLNTAPVEVLRALPHWYRIVHADPDAVDPVCFPRTALAEAVVSYRDRLDDASGGFANGPDYTRRDAPGRGDRGLASTGEILLLRRPGSDVTRDAGLGDVVPGAWTAAFAARDPFDTVASGPAAADLGTDVVGRRVDATLGDGVSGDSEEAGLLFAGASNLVTTRSDLFTVHFRIRSFRRNEVTGVWDATDPERIVDDTRYVMLVDRSRIERPSDAPAIRFLEKLAY
ncbi:MAG: hypothetical protein GY715_15910 [Planctomycetes bacterium]|nr:hypothetical protein [Planctomycetota bacterium]